MKRQNKNRWEDSYSRNAKKNSYPARSVYKLEEVQKKFKVIKKGDRVLDLGCYPGSWLLYAAKLTGKSGYVVGIDKQKVKIDLPENVKVYCEDIYNTLNFFGDKERFSIIISDMAPDTTGSKFTDAVRSFELSNKALDMTDGLLDRGGNFVCKIFQGEDFEEFYKKVGLSFKQKKIFKPQSSRKSSREIYVVGLGKK